MALKNENNEYFTRIESAGPISIINDNDRVGLVTNVVVGNNDTANKSNGDWTEKQNEQDAVEVCVTPEIKGIQHERSVPPIAFVQGGANDGKYDNALSDYDDDNKEDYAEIEVTIQEYLETIQSLKKVLTQQIVRQEELTEENKKLQETVTNLLSIKSDLSQNEKNAATVTTSSSEKRTENENVGIELTDGEKRISMSDLMGLKKDFMLRELRNKNLSLEEQANQYKSDKMDLILQLDELQRTLIQERKEHQRILLEATLTPSTRIQNKYRHKSLEMESNGIKKEDLEVFQSKLISHICSILDDQKVKCLQDFSALQQKIQESKFSDLSSDFNDNNNRTTTNLHTSLHSKKEPLTCTDSPLSTDNRREENECAPCRRTNNSSTTTLRDDVDKQNYHRISKKHRDKTLKESFRNKIQERLDNMLSQSIQPKRTKRIARKGTKSCNSILQNQCDEGKSKKDSVPTVLNQYDRVENLLSSLKQQKQNSYHGRYRRAGNEKNVSSSNVSESIRDFEHTLGNMHSRVEKM